MAIANGVDISLAAVMLNFAVVRLLNRMLSSC
jgi:hypothetical protein